jgi:diaminopimelate epimerase
MKFAKMQATGNDFILFQGENYNDFINNKEIEFKIARLCDRHFGIGGDGLMFSLPSSIADIKMNYYNSDGSTAALCGNGIRCFAKFVFEEGIVKKDVFDIETLAGIKRVRLFLSDNKVEKVSVNIGRPVFIAKEIPIIIERKKEDNKIKNMNLSVNGQNFDISVLKVGVPHSVIFNSIENEMETIGKEIENDEVFPEGINVNFVNILKRGEVELKTWERGAGRTLACGTGACASVIAGIERKLLDGRVIVKTEGGDLEVLFDGKGEITLIGEAKTVFYGKIYL